jgi:tetratricopeptide (TPR) repeat protein
VAWALQKTGDSYGSEKHLRSAIKTDPGDQVAHYQLGKHLLFRRELKQAKQCFLRAIKLDPDYTKAHYKLAEVLKEVGDLDNAIKHLKRALEIEPPQVKADVHKWFNYGTLLESRGDVDAAVSAYKEVLKIDREHSKASNNMGSILLREGKLEEARVCLEDAVLMDPTDPIARLNLSSVYRALIDDNNCGLTSLRPDGQIVRADLRPDARKAKQLEGLLEGSVVEEDEELSCVICLERPRTWVFQACGHLCLCKACARKQKAKELGGKKLQASQRVKVNCPVCREYSEVVPRTRHDGECYDP